MSATALVLVLASAVAHAGWNLLLARSPDARAATAGALVVVALLCVPLGLAGGSIGSAAVPYAAGSVAAELAYLVLLAAAYARADLSVVYPVARGSAPVLVLIAGGLTGGAVSALAAAGVMAVAGGVVLVRGLHRPQSGGDLLLALGVGACIATYTLLDAKGLHHADTAAYLAVVLGLPAALYASAFAVLDRTGRLRRAAEPATALAGAAMLGAYGLVLAGLTLAPAALVAAARESGVLVAVAFGALLLGEPVGPRRWAGAVAVVTGIALITLG